MKYIEPDMKIVLLSKDNVIVTSLTSGDNEVSTEENVGGGTSAGGGWQ